MDTTSLWNSPQSVYPALGLIIVIALLFYVGANSLFSKVLAVVRSSVSDITLPLELMALPFRVLVSLVGLAILVRYVPIASDIKELLHHALLIIAIIGVSWFIMRLLMVLEQFILWHFAATVGENEATRKIATPVNLARKILNVLCVLLAISGVLMTFDTVRQVGLSILASAGIVGVMLGFAAQKSLTTLISGIQIAITQPISIGDEVIVENEKGIIEEITLTYVVVQLWDQRRMIVPITWFIDRPFQNWTRTSPELLGTVFLYLDYAISPEAIRRELERIVSATPLWDKRLATLQVTNTTEKSVEIRALVSAANSSDVWELRCFVREQLIAFLRINYAEYLPKVMTQMDQGGISGVHKVLP
ncbi:MAG: mechanosensitive ion channel domain-containing protein [Chlorobiaceae bacterium]